MTKKIAKNLGISDAQAEEWFKRFQEGSEISYIGMERLAGSD